MIALDFETYYSAKYSVSDMGYHAYTHHKDFDAYLVAWAHATGSGAAHPSKFNWTQVHGRQVLAHNAPFDRAVFERLQELGTIPASIQPAGWIDTAGLAAYCQCPRSLADASEAILNRKLDKNPRDQAKGKQSSDLFNSMDEYATQDAKTCWDIYQAAGKFWPAHERELSALTCDMGRVGIGLDGDYLQQQMRKIHDLLEDAERRIPWAITAQPGSPKALAEACEGAGVKPPTSTDATDEAWLEWEAANYETEPWRWAKAVQDYRRANRTEQVLFAMHDRKLPGDRMEAFTRYFGAFTGRWSGGGHGLNLQNLTTDTEEADLRGCLVPGPGQTFLVLDLAQIEARILLWAVGDRDTLNLVRQGMSVYEAHARATMGWAAGNLKASDPKLYKLAKARVLGLGYGCGAKKFGAVARSMAGLELTDKEAADCVKAYREANPLVTHFWDTLGGAFDNAHGSTYRLALPSGRQLMYRNVDRDEGTAEQIKGKRSKVYGGLLVENHIQATARDLFADRLLSLVKAGFKPVLLVHDEYVLEAPEHGAEDAMKQAAEIIRRVPAWAEGLPVEVEGKLMRRYSK
jgi:DNA polymerase I-like protein with 3'-5' exonuclease and polymerase domains